MEIKRTKRILGRISLRMKKQFISNQKISPYCCEISYFNKLKSNSFDLRSYLFGWVFATLLEQHGFALRIIHAGKASFKKKIFGQFIEHSLSNLF
jgi:hypothetical protein